MRTNRKFITARYEVYSEKLKKHAVSIAMVSDLHNLVFGRGNERLFRTMETEKPDMILIAGDLVLGKPGQNFQDAYDFLAGAVKIAPVFYAMGNHEHRMKLFPEIYGEEYFAYEKKIKQLGVTMLENQTEEVILKGEKIQITGLLLPYRYYDKKRSFIWKKRNWMSF